MNGLDFTEHVAEILPLSFSIVSLDGRVLFANRHALRLFEIQSLEELKDLKVPLVWKDPSKREEWVKAIRETGVVRNMETEMVSSSGRTIWLLASGMLIDYKSEPAILSIHNEITDRKRREEVVVESERWFRTLSDTTATAIYIYQGDQFVFANDAACRVTGYSREEFLSLPHVWDIIHPDHREMARERALGRQQGKDVPDNYELKLVRKDGQVRWLDVTAGIIEWDGKPAALGTAYDITKRKEAFNQVESLLKEKDLILKEAHHRVKNNMTVISSLLSLQSANVSDPECKNILQDAASRAQSMMVLYDKLYREGGAGALSLREFVQSLIQEIMRPFYMETPITTQLDVQDVPINTKTLSSLGIVLNELITNSMKHAFQGRDRGTIGVWASLNEAAGADDETAGAAVPGDVAAGGTAAGGSALAYGTDGGGNGADGLRTLRLTYWDDGAGLPDGVDLGGDSTFGLQLIKILVEQLGGTVEMTNKNGTHFEIVVPMKDVS